MRDLRLAVAEMQDTVFSQMGEQRRKGKLSKAHSYDHVENVAKYAGKFAPYFAKRLGVSDSEKLAYFAEMDGLAHDVIRYASETDSGEDASARFLEDVYDVHFSSLVPKEDYDRLVVGIVRNSAENFARMRELYQNDPEALAVALAVVSGDKLIEASGPRVLERRAFFVGNERMRNPKDLGAVFKHPDESSDGVLTETMVRLGDINHVSNYSSEPSLLNLAQELHTYQYHWYKGLLGNMEEAEALEFLLKRLRSSETTASLAKRVEKGGSRLVAEQHLNGKYFEENNLNILLKAVKTPPEDLHESSWLLVSLFSVAKDPEEIIKTFELRPYGPPTLRIWMRAIIKYRSGDFGEDLLERLEGLE